MGLKEFFPGTFTSKISPENVYADAKLTEHGRTISPSSSDMFAPNLKWMDL